MSDINIKPCPMCGDHELDGGPYPTNREKTQWRLICGNPDCRCCVEADSMEEVVRRWNNRVENSNEEPNQEPQWVAIKAQHDALDDGDGPYMSWPFYRDPDRIHHIQYWKDFLVWAKDHLGQGFSVACNDGDFVNPVTRWTYEGYVAGREHGTSE